MNPDILRRMREDWDARAREDAKEYIAAGLTDDLMFPLSGLQDCYHLLEDIYPHLGKDSRVLEIGCGIGRMLRFLALLFPEVHGIDVSPEMIQRAQAYLAQFPNVTAAVGDGRSLAPYADDYFDLVFSYQVFQHIPEEAVIRSYVDEARRVLRPRGIFKGLVKVRDWEGEPATKETWNGVSITEDDVSRWLDETGFVKLNAYSLDPYLVSLVLQAPE